LFTANKYINKLLSSSSFIKSAYIYGVLTVYKALGTGPGLGVLGRAEQDRHSPLPSSWSVVKHLKNYLQKSGDVSWAWWLMPIILTTQK
jgi:hypothetical protein